MKYHCILILAGLALASCCPYAHRDDERDVPHGSKSAEVNRLFESYLFLSYPEVEHFGGERVRPTQGNTIIWNGFTSSHEVEKVISYYLGKMGKDNYKSNGKGKGGCWRFPTKSPRRVLSVYPIDEKGPHLGYKKDIPSNSKTVIIISRR